MPKDVTEKSDSLRCYEAAHRVARVTLEAQSGLGMDDVSKCLPGWIKTFCEKSEAGEGCVLSHSAVNAIAHTLIAARARQHRLISERDALRSWTITDSIVANFNEFSMDVADGKYDDILKSS